uniref:Uncharacterized protein n=1 Tax=Picea sitchensis TaxID=3332 RepID=D5AAL1_PICSI|nr:unknown [Picea sitchensis]
MGGYQVVPYCCRKSVSLEDNHLSVSASHTDIFSNLIFGPSSPQT